MKKSLIRRLSDGTINRIAAGEVIERPASILKELLENSLDSGATRIEVAFRDGGETWLQVRDNGGGMNRDDLDLCWERHATSKCPDEDFLSIKTLGFRGEALASIASIARVTIATAQEGDSHGWSQTCEGGVKSELIPSPHPVGTTVTVRDVFFATPARLKFLKSKGTERGHCIDWFQRLALAYPEVTITLREDEKMLFSYPASDWVQRVKHLWGEDVSPHLWSVDHEDGPYRVQAVMSLPTKNRRSPDEQYFFVNQRYVRDRMITGLLRQTYEDVLSSDRYPFTVIHLRIPGEEVDMNVHPCKTEVRFLESSKIRSYILRPLRLGMAENDQRSAAVIPMSVNAPPRIYEAPPPSTVTPRASYAPTRPITRELLEGKSTESSPPLSPPPLAAFPNIPQNYRIWGHWGQTYVVAEYEGDLLLIDAHALHERAVYERLKSETTVASQALLTPIMVPLETGDRERLLTHQELLKNHGIMVDIFGEMGALRTLPAFISGCGKELLESVLEDLKVFDNPMRLKERLWERLASLSCHNSVRSGRPLSTPEMVALVEAISQTPRSGQCNHGRPTHIRLSLKDAHRLFERM